MRIVLINSLYRPDIGGGAEIMVEIQATELCKQGHDVLVIALCGDKEARLEEIDGIKVYRSPIKNVYFHHHPAHKAPLIKLGWHIIDSYARSDRYYETLNVISSFDPDIVSIHNAAGFGAGIFKALTDRGFHVTLTLHDQYLWCARSVMFRNDHRCTTQCLDCRCLRLSHKQHANYLNGVIGVSRFILNKAQENGYFSQVKKTIVIHNPVAMNCLASRNNRPREAQKLVYGYLGSITPSKGVDLLTNAFSSSILSPRKLLIAGHGDSQFINRLKKRCNPGDIDFLGFIARNEFFSSIDCLIVPSILEDTFPGVIQESIANGIPVIGSNLGGIPEMIIDGSNGILFSPTDTSSLSTAIFRFENIRHHLYQQMHVYTELELSAARKTWIHQIESFYKDVLAQPIRNLTYTPG